MTRNLIKMLRELGLSPANARRIAKKPKSQNAKALIEVIELLDKHDISIDTLRNAKFIAVSRG